MSETTGAAGAAGAATATATPKRRESWSKFYSAHSPVMYNELIERWGGETELWEAYANGRMEPAEEEYFSGPKIFNAARAFANVVLPAVRKITGEGAAAYEVFQRLEERVAAFEQQVAVIERQVAAVCESLGLDATGLGSDLPEPQKPSSRRRAARDATAGDAATATAGGQAE